MGLTRIMRKLYNMLEVRWPCSKGGDYRAGPRNRYANLRRVLHVHAGSLASKLAFTGKRKTISTQYSLPARIGSDKVPDAILSPSPC